MANVETAETGTKRGKAEHGYIGPDGMVVDKIEAATGISYKNLATGRVFTYQIPGAMPGSPGTMIGIFGAKTLATNCTSAVRNSKDDPGTPEDEDAALVERFGDIKQGDWGVERGGGGGRAIDLELLLEALARQFKAEKKPFDGEKYRAKLADDEVYRKKVYGLDSVKARYLALRSEKAGGGVDAITLD